MDDQLMTRDQVGDYLSVSARTVDRMIADGRLPTHRLSARAIRIRRSDVEKLLEEVKDAKDRSSDG